MKSSRSSALLLVVFASVILSATAGRTAKCTTVAVLLKKTKNLSSLTAAVAAVPFIQTTLSNQTMAATVFAPTDAALASFAKLHKMTLKSIISNMDIVAMILENHVVSEEALTKKLLLKHLKKPLTTLAYQNLTLSYTKGVLGVKPVGKAKAAAITKYDLVACKSVVHIVDHVLLPDGVMAR